MKVTPDGSVEAVQPGKDVSANVGLPEPATWKFSFDPTTTLVVEPLVMDELSTGTGWRTHAVG